MYRAFFREMKHIQKLERHTQKTRVDGIVSDTIPTREPARIKPKMR